MMPSFAVFLKNTYADKNFSRSLSLASLLILYEPWKKTEPLDSPDFFRLVQKILGPPDQGDQTSPPAQVLWKRGPFKRKAAVFSHLDIKGDEKSVLALARPRGFEPCPVCKELAISKAIILECGHKLCLTCTDKIKQYSENQSFPCPLCRNPTEQLISSLVIYRTVKQFHCPGTACTANDMGLEEFENHIWYECEARHIQCECGNLVKALNWGTHQQTKHSPPSRCQCGEILYIKRGHECEYTPVECEKCPAKITRKDLETHLNTACPFATACKCCGLPGPRHDIEEHEALCSVSPCNMCDEILRTDKLAHHQSICPSRPFECVVEGCTQAMSFSELKKHIVTAHPVLVDTGIYSGKTPALYIVRDTKASLCIGMKLNETEADIQIRYLGWDVCYDEWIPRGSSRILSLEDNLDCLLESYPPTIFPRIFKKGGLGALIKNDRLSHKDVELLCYLEKTYKESERGGVGLDEEKKEEED